MAKRKTALEQAIATIKAQRLGVGPATLGGLISNITKGLGFAGKGLNTSASNRIRPIPVPTPASTSVPKPKRDITNIPNTPILNILKENVLAQYAFTPQAEKYLRGVTVTQDDIAKQGAAGLYTSTRLPSGQPLRGFITLDTGMLGAGQRRTGFTADVLAHEFGHSLDANVNVSVPASFPRTGLGSADSGGFFNKTNKQNNPFRVELANFLNLYKVDGEALGEKTKDIESFAQTTARVGSRALLGPGGSTFNNVFIPMSKSPINYSPVFPTSEYLENLRKDERRKF